MLRTPALLITALGGLVLSVTVGAQALKGHDSNAPIDFEADRIEVQDRADRALLTGNVRIRQAGLALDSARLTVAYSGDVTGGDVSVSRLDASGGVVVRKGNETARSQFAIYDVRGRTITMLGGVTLARGAENLSGGRLVINLDSGRSVIDGSTVSATPGPDGTVTSGGRVRGTFKAPQRN